MKILVVSGFLGAGKTTFIQNLAEHTGKEFAILENEYGEVGIDGDLLKEQQTIGGVSIWELTEGCICCSKKGDLAASVLTIANTLDPEYLVIEPTGAGMLSHIIANLQQIEYERISLLAPVTIVDGRSLQQPGEYRELYRDQIRAAKTVFVSRTENSGEEEKLLLKNALEKLHPDGDIRVDHYSAMKKEEWLELLNKKYDGTSFEKEPETETLPDTFSMKGIRMKAPEQLILLLERLIHGEFGNIIRAKGSFQAGEEFLRFDVVNGYYSATGAEKVHEGKAVFIGSDIQRQRIRRYFIENAGKIRLGSKPGLPRRALFPLEEPAPDDEQQEVNTCIYRNQP